MTRPVHHKMLHVTKHAGLRPLFFVRELSRRFEFVGLANEIGTGTALGLGGIAWQFDAVDGEHLPTNQALSIAEVEDLGEQSGDVVAQSRDKGGNRGEVRGAVAGERDEGDVLAAQAFAAPAADDAFGVGAKDDLEQHSRWVGRGAGGVVVVARVKTRKIKVVFEQVMHGMGKAAR